ncbi:MAG: hypothetical protein R3C05_02780 [Pirellulaceae bacterium]
MSCSTDGCRSPWIISRSNLDCSGKCAAINARDIRWNDVSNLDVAWRVDLDRLNASSDAVAQRIAPIQLTSFDQQPDTTQTAYLVRGAVQGRAAVRGDSDAWRINVDATAENLELLELEASAPADQVVQQNGRRSGGESLFLLEGTERRFEGSTGIQTGRWNASCRAAEGRHGLGRSDIGR